MPFHYTRDDEGNSVATYTLTVGASSRGRQALGHRVPRRLNGYPPARAIPPLNDPYDFMFPQLDSHFLQVGKGFESPQLHQRKSVDHGNK